MPKKTLHKMVAGYVDQVMEEQEDGTFVCVRQEFIEQDGTFDVMDSCVLTENAERVTDYPKDKEIRQPFNMHQPNEKMVITISKGMHNVVQKPFGTELRIIDYDIEDDWNTPFTTKDIEGDRCDAFIYPKGKTREDKDLLDVEVVKNLQKIF